MIAAVRGLARLLPRTPRWVALGALLAALQAALLIPVGLLLKEAFDETIPGGDVDGLILIGVLLITLFVASGAVALLTRRLVLRATKEAIAVLRITLLARLQALPMSWHDRVDGSRLHSILVMDSERVDVMANALAGQGAPAVIISGALAIALLVIDPLLVAVLLVTVPAMVLLSRALRPRLTARTRSWQGSFDRFSGRMHFAIRGRPLIASHATERIEEEAAEREIRRLSDDGLSMAWMQSLYGQVNTTLAAISTVVVLVVGGAAVAEGSSTLGSLVSFYALLGILRASTSQLAAALPQMISGAESLRRIEEVLEISAPPAYEGGERRIEWSGSFALRGVGFSYGTREILRSIDLEAGPGEVVALTGPIGVGKTTIAALLLGLYRPDRGVVEADGKPLAELDLAELRRQAAVVSQSPILFPGTIADNIAYGRMGAGAEEVADAVELSGGTDALAELPDGLETRVGEEGGRLSGGQRQLVEIARAVLRRPRLLILDEPTRGLDPGLRAGVLAAVRELPWKPTVLLISHERDALISADRILELDSGRIRPLATDPTLAGASLER